MAERTGRRSRSRAAARGGSGTTAVLVTLLVSVFVALGVGPVAQLMARVLPTSESDVEIVGRDSRTSMGGVIGRGISTGGTTYYVTIRRADGSLMEVAAPRALHDVALPGLAELGEARLERSVLLGLPVAMTIVSQPLVDLPALGIGGDPVERRYALLMPLAGALIGSIFCGAVIGYLMWRLPEKRSFRWPIFAVGISVAAALGTLWWV